MLLDPAPLRRIPHDGEAQASNVAEILTIREAVILLRVSDTTIRRLVRAEAIPYFRAGQQLRFVRAELMAWATGRSPGSGGPQN
jgi:excisionase family DNA binding protein